MPTLPGRYGPALLLVLLTTTAPLGAQVGHAVQERPVDTILAPGVVQMLDLLQWRMQGHTMLPATEHVVCLLGYLTPDRTVITDISAALVTQAGPTWARFRCMRRPDLIGAAHTHLVGVTGCAASATDLATLGTAGLRVLIITCDAGHGRTGLVIYRADRMIPTYLIHHGIGVHP